MAITIELTTGKRISVERDSATIGQGPGADIVVKSSELQPIHARIGIVAGRWMVESTGDWLLQAGEGVPGRKQWLEPDQVIRLTESGVRVVFQPTVQRMPVSEPNKANEAPFSTTNGTTVPSRGTSQANVPVLGKKPSAMSQWYYSKDNQQQGPVSPEQLKQLAASGQLKPSDLVWKEGMGQWAEARRLKGLFPIQTTANPPLPKPVPVTPPPLSPRFAKHDTSTGNEQPRATSADGHTTSFVDRAQAAGKLAACKTKLLMLVRVSLPNSFTQLGEVAYNNGSTRDIFHEQFEALDALCQEMGDLHSTQHQQKDASARGFGSTAMAAAHAVKRKAKFEKLNLNQRLAFQALGKAIADKNLTQAISATLAVRIAELLTARQSLENHIQQLSAVGTQSFLSAKRILACATVFLMILGGYVGYRVLARRGSTTVPGSPGQPVLVDTQRLVPVIRGLQDSIRQIGDGIGKETVVRLAKEGEKDKANRRRLEADREKQRLKDKEQALANLKIRNQLRLEAVYRFYVPQKPKVSIYPPRPRIATPIRIYETPLQVLKTPFDDITSIRISPDTTLIDYNNDHRLIRFENLSSVSVDYGSCKRLDHYKNTTPHDETQNGFEFVRKILYGTSPGRFERFRYSSLRIEPVVYCSDGRWLAYYGCGNSAGFTFLSFWVNHNGQVELLNVFGLGREAKGGRGLYEHERIIDAAVFDDKLILLTVVETRDVNGIHATVHATEQLRIWSKDGLLGSIDTGYKLGLETMYARLFTVEPATGQVALFYGPSVRIYDADAIIKHDGVKVEPLLKALSAPFPPRPSLGGEEAHVEFSPDGKTLAISWPSSDPTEGLSSVKHFSILSFFDTATWTQKSQVRIQQCPLHHGGFSPNGSMYSVYFESPLGRAIQLWSVKDGTLIRTFQAFDVATVKFLNDHLLLAGGASRTNNTSPFSYKEKDIGPRNINIWEVFTGSLWGRLTIRDVTSLDVSPNRRYLVTGRSKYINEPAILEKWDLSKPDKSLPFEDEFAFDRKTEFEDFSLTDPMTSICAAPFVEEADYDKVRIGMTYSEVVKIFLGVGQFRAEVVDVDKSKYGYGVMVRATVAYPAMGSKKSSYMLTFEGNLYGEPYQIKLVKKVRN